MSQTRVPGALAGSMSNHAEVDLLKYRIRELKEKKDQHKEKLHRIKRNAEEWENRAKACLTHDGGPPHPGLRQQDLLDAFDVAAKKHAAQHKEKHYELQRLRQQLASTDHDRANANKTTDCQIQALNTQLANEQQARAKTEALMQAQLKGLRDELNKEKQAHEVAQKAAKHWESLRAKDLETLKAKLAEAKKDYDSKLAEAKNRLDKKLVEINKEFDTKLKTARANWNPERTALKANVVEAKHKALETKTSLDTLASDNHNLESSLNVLGELESESQQHVVELRSDTRRPMKLIKRPKPRFETTRSYLEKP